MQSLGVSVGEERGGEEKEDCRRRIAWWHWNGRREVCEDRTGTYHNVEDPLVGRRIEVEVGLAGAERDDVHERALRVGAAPSARAQLDLEVEVVAEGRRAEVLGKRRRRHRLGLAQGQAGDVLEARRRAEAHAFERGRVDRFDLERHLQLALIVLAVALRDALRVGGVCARACVRFVSGRLCANGFVCGNSPRRCKTPHRPPPGRRCRRPRRPPP